MMEVEEASRQGPDSQRNPQASGGRERYEDHRSEPKHSLTSDTSAIARQDPYRHLEYVGECAGADLSER
jgi:hypothetical protein